MVGTVAVLRCCTALTAYRLLICALRVRRGLLVVVVVVLVLVDLPLTSVDVRRRSSAWLLGWLLGWASARSPGDIANRQLVSMPDPPEDGDDVRSEVRRWGLPSDAGEPPSRVEEPRGVLDRTSVPVTGDEQNQGHDSQRSLNDSSDLADPAGAENRVRAGHAACSYS
jgi:hypothetical protein